MLELNKQYNFKIKDVGMNFEGIAKSDDGLTVFVPGALKDEEVNAKIIKLNKNYALGDLKEIKEDMEQTMKLSIAMNDNPIKNTIGQRLIRAVVRALSPML